MENYTLMNNNSSLIKRLIANIDQSCTKGYYVIKQY